MAGVAGLPDTSNINGCDTKTRQNEPGETAVNPSDCRTAPPVRGSAYFVHLVGDIYRALPTLPKAAKPFAYNLIEQLENDIMSGPVWGDHPLQQPQAAISYQLEGLERALKSKAA